MEEMLSKQKAYIFMEVHGAYVESCYRGGMNVLREMIASNNYTILACDGLACHLPHLRAGSISLPLLILHKRMRRTIRHN